MNDDLASPDFRKYRYHLARWWWLPLVLGVLFATLALGAGFAGSAATSTAVLVPVTPPETEIYDPGYEPGAGVRAAVTVLTSDDFADEIADELGFRPAVTLTFDSVSGAVTVRSSAAEGADATAARDAYVARLLALRADVINTSLSRAIDGLEARRAEFDASVALIDERLDSSAAGSEQAIAASAERAALITARAEVAGDIASLSRLIEVDQPDIKVGAQTAGEGRAAQRGGVLALVGGFLAGALLGLLFVVARAYFDSRVRTRSDLALAGLPTFGVLNSSASEADGAALELAVALAGGHGGAGEAALLTFDGVDAEAVKRQVADAASRLNLPLADVRVAATAAERLRVAREDAASAVLVAPGRLSSAEVAAEWASLRRAGTNVVGVVLVASSKRRARQSA